MGEIVSLAERRAALRPVPAAQPLEAPPAEVVLTIDTNGRILIDRSKVRDPAQMQWLMDRLGEAMEKMVSRA